MGASVLRKLLRRSPEERSLVIRTAILLCVVRIALRLTDLPTLRRYAHRYAVGAKRSRTRYEPRQIAWAVAAAGNRIPGTGNCLVQALAAQILLEQSGHPAEIRIGVLRPGQAPLRAHAWVESRGEVVVGAGGMGKYTPLPSLGDAAS